MNHDLRVFLLIKLFILLLLSVGSFSSASESKSLVQSEVIRCIEQQVENYGDLCSESAIGYEDMSGSEAFYEGVSCAAVSIKICLGLKYGDD